MFSFNGVLVPLSICISLLNGIFCINKQGKAHKDITKKKTSFTLNCWPLITELAFDVLILTSILLTSCDRG